MYKIRIHENTSIKDIDLWSTKAATGIVFEISNASSFALLAEGVALGMLRDFELAGLNISIELQQSPLIIKEQKKEKVGSKLLPPILSTIFGLELLHISRLVTVHDDQLAFDLRSLIGSHIWGEVQRSKGVISSGKFVYLVSRHGYDVPLALRQSLSPSSFPSFESFQKNISNYLADFRSGNYSSATEKKLIEWVFHCAENSFEHASQNAGKAIEGYRGIILQKIKLEKSDDIQKRNDLPDILKNYISQRIEDGQVGRAAVVHVATVVDLGVGIHNTLPDNPGASNLDKLQLAFKNGVTSKNTNEHEKAGYGLGEAASAARHLNALLFLVSSNQIAFDDFSDRTRKQLPDQDLTLVSLGEITKASGSTISLIWASNPEQEDQLAIEL